jgi:hypothetical protein
MEEQEERWYKKKVFRTIPVWMVLAIVSVVGLSSYLLLTATSHFTIVEGIEVQYNDSTGNWQSLPVNGGNVDLGQTNLKPGDINTFVVAIKNTASSGVIGAHLQADQVDGLTHSLSCVEGSSGVKYQSEGNDLYVKVPSGGISQIIGINTIASNLLTPGIVLTFNNKLYRDEPLSSYASSC